MSKRKKYKTLLGDDWRIVELYLPHHVRIQRKKETDIVLGHVHAKGESRRVALSNVQRTESRRTVGEASG